LLTINFRICESGLGTAGEALLTSRSPAQPRSVGFPTRRFPRRRSLQLTC
jgi:hypothetical protein